MSMTTSVVSAAILEGNLILGLSDGSVINCGYVQGPPGLKGDAGPMGADGDPGRDGNTIITVGGTPRNDAGTDGDYAIDNVNWRIYGPKSGGTWGKANDMLPSKDNLIVNGRGFEGGAGGSGDSGGGGGGGGIVAITSGEGIEAGPTSTSPNITISASVKTENGLKFEDDKIAINIGTGLSFDASTGALTAISSGGGADVTVGPNAPLDPTEGELWFDTNETPPILKVHDGTDWKVSNPQENVDLSEYAKIAYVDDKTSDIPYRIETDKVTRAGKEVRSGEPEIQLVDNEDNFTNVTFTGNNGIAVTSDIQGIQFDGSALAVKTEVTAIATDLQNQIDDLEVQKGSAANYDCKSITPGYNCRSGEIAFIDATASAVGLLGLGLEDKSGNLTKTINVGDIIEIDAAGGSDTRYRATDVTGAPLLITVEFVSGEQTFAIDQQYTVYIYPQNEAGASKNYVDDQLALKADTATVNAALDDKADKSELNQYVTTSTANSTYLRDGATTNKLMINRTAGGSIDSMKITNITGGGTVWRLDAKAGSNGPVIYKTEGTGTHNFVGKVNFERVGDERQGFKIEGRKSDGTIGDLFHVYHNGGSVADAVNYSGKILSANNIVNKQYVDDAIAGTASALATEDAEPDIHYGSSEPTEAGNGDLWVDTSNMRLLMRVANEWVNASQEQESINLEPYQKIVSPSGRKFKKANATSAMTNGTFTYYESGGQLKLGINRRDAEGVKWLDINFTDNLAAPVLFKIVQWQNNTNHKTVRYGAIDKITAADGGQVTCDVRYHSTNGSMTTNSNYFITIGGFL